MKFLRVLALILLFAGNAAAIDVAGVHLDPTVAVNGHTLKLNGYGIRKKFFVKVYIGSLYATHHLSTPAEVLQDTGEKLIRMNFLHSNVGKEKIIEAFNEGFANNAPDIAGSADVRRFLSFFTSDFRRGDVVDLVLGANGTVVAKHNGRVLGKITSGRLANGILAIYFGDRPADEDLKRGMLGRG